MGCYEFRSLLPDNATALETSVETVLAKKYCDVDIKLVSALSDPWKCPAEFLPWLAFAESVDVWNDLWPEQTKRMVIANAVALHQRKGTTGGVRDALAALGVNMSMISWHEMEPEGEVGTASFELWINDNINPDAAVMLDKLMIRDIVQTIERNKRLSVHYELTIGVELTTTLRLASSGHAATQMDMDAEHTHTRINTRPMGGQLALSGQTLSQTDVSAEHLNTRITTRPCGAQVGLSGQLVSQIDVMAEHLSTRINSGIARLQYGLSAQFATITYIKAVHA